MIAVTGATGQLGKLVVDELIKRGADPKTIVALVRDREKAKDLVSKGVDVRVANYDQPETLDAAFKGVDKVLLISANELGKRGPQHANVVKAAKKANVKLLAYTSILKADTSKMILAGEHLETENLIKASGISYVFLRNSWYIENYTGQLPGYLEHGAIAGAAKDGRVSAATRADYAAAAAAILLKSPKSNAIYELGGKAFTLPELAATISKTSGKKVEYKDMPKQDYEQMLKGVGLPAPIAEMFADSDIGITRGDLFTESRDLENLIGHAPTTVEASLKA